MNVNRSQACRPCIAKAIGPALIAIGEPVETPRSTRVVDDRPIGTPVGCCHEEGTRYAFTYFYPYPES